MEERMTNIEQEARDLVADLDGIVEDFGLEPTAEAIADWWVESHFTFEGCPWTDAEAAANFAAMRTALANLGLPA
jgi:hypothetical protein